MSVTFTYKLEFYIAAAWVDKTADVWAGAPISATWGITGSKPTDRVARPGILSFSMVNATSNSGGKMGYYSPGHADAYAGFDLGTLVRYSETYSGTTYYKFYGKITDIKVVPGKYGQRVTNCQAADYMYELMTRTVSQVPIQINKRIDEAIHTLVDEMAVQPLAHTYAAGSDLFQYLFFGDKSERITPYTNINKLCLTDFSYFFRDGDTSGGENLIYQSRHTRIPFTSSATLNDTMNELEITRSMNNVYNIVKVTSKPPRIDEAATTVMASLSETKVLSMVGGGRDTLTITLNYVDPQGADALISGIEMVEPVANTDYTALSFGGEDMTGDLTVAVTFGASSALVTLTNTNINKNMRVTFFQLRGKGVYPYDPVDYTASDTASITAYGERELSYNAPYLMDENLAADFATELIRRYHDPINDVTKVKFCANKNTTQMAAALLYIGNLVTITETVSGINTTYFINGITHELTNGGKVLWCTWYLEKANLPTNYWLLDVAAHSTLDVSTYLIF